MEEGKVYEILMLVMVSLLFIEVVSGINSFSETYAETHLKSYYLKYGVLSVVGFEETNHGREYYNCKVVNYTDGVFPSEIVMKCASSGD